MKEYKFIRVEKDIYERVEELAKVDRRSVTGQVNTMLWESYVHWGEEERMLSGKDPLPLPELIDALDRRLKK